MNVHAVLTGITVLIARSVRCPHLPHVKARFLIRTSPIRAVLKQCNDLLMVGKKTVNIGNALEKVGVDTDMGLCVEVSGEPRQIEVMGHIISPPIKFTLQLRRHSL